VAGALAAAVTLVAFDLATLCDNTPPCPRGGPCVAIKIIGPCGPDVVHVVIAVLIGAAIASATLGLMWRRFRAAAGVSS
jgi:hypothetical protein